MSKPDSGRRLPRERIITLIVGCSSIAAYTFAVARLIPNLRHDWIWTPTLPSLLTTITWHTGGWDERTGLGTPISYPTNFLLVPLLDTLQWILGDHVSLVVFCGAIAIVIYSGGRSLAIRFGAPPLAREVLAVFALANPWVFNETVAGHTFMLLSYGSGAWLISEALARSPRDRVLVPACLGVFIQLQFFLLAIPCCVLLFTRKRSWKALVVALVLAAPCVYGVATNRTALLGIPYQSIWQQSQSVAPWSAVALSGYFTHYGDAIPSWPALLLAATSAIGLITGRAQPRLVLRLSALITIASTFIASGTKGPLASLYLAAVQHFPETAVYRELYDLLALSALGYLALTAAACARWPRVGTSVAFAAALGLVVAWFASPPDRWWIDRDRLPKLTVDGAPNTRFALVPAFQPLASAFGGSGIDPDWYPRGDVVTPINTYLASTYPEGAALAAFLQNGDTRMLAALGVDRIYGRTWLHPVNELNQQMPFPLQKDERRESRLVRGVIPLVSVGPPPALVDIPPTLSDDSVFSIDAMRMPMTEMSPEERDATETFRAIRPTAGLDASKHWVDLRLTYADAPMFAQPYGGAVTTSTAPLPLPKGRQVLAWVSGTLAAKTSSGSLVLRAPEQRYQWLELPRGATSLICHGRCVAVFTRDFTSKPSGANASTNWNGAHFTRTSPWMIVVQLAPGRKSTLRVADRYDPNWSAYSKIPLVHFRLAGAFNAWLVPDHHTNMTVVLLHVPSIVILALEAIAVMTLIAVYGTCFKRPPLERAFETRGVSV